MAETKLNSEQMKSMVENIIEHPDFRIFEFYVREQFKGVTDIDGIDTDKESTNVHAQVLAGKNMKKEVNSLFRGLDLLKKIKNKKKTGYE